MAANSGKVNSALTAFDADAAITAWEALPNIKTVEKIGVPGANVAAEISNGIAGLRVTTDDPAVEDWAAVINDVGDIDASQTSITYDGGTGTKPSLPFVIVIESEHLNVTADTGTVLTVVRGYDGTTGAIHLNDVTIDTVVGADDITDQYTASAVISGVTFQTANGEAAPA
jgi:hypothetical protein